MSNTPRWHAEHRTSRTVSSPVVVVGPTVRLPPHRGQRASFPDSKICARTCAVSSGENIAGVSRRRSGSTRRSLPMRRSNATAMIRSRRGGGPRRLRLRGVGLKASGIRTYAVSLIRFSSWGRSYRRSGGLQPADGQTHSLPPFVAKPYRRNLKNISRIPRQPYPTMLGGTLGGTALRPQARGSRPQKTGRMPFYRVLA